MTAEMRRAERARADYLTIANEDLEDYRTGFRALSEPNIRESIRLLMVGSHAHRAPFR